MIVLSAAETAGQLEAWRSVRMAVLPNERTASVEDLRAQSSPQRLLLLAHLGGALAGAGVSNRSDTGGVFVQPRVLPAFRRRGVGTALLRGLADHAVASGHGECGAHVEIPGSLPFAERFGFREVDRQVEQVRSVGPAEAEPVVPVNVALVPLAGRHDLVARLFEELVRDAVGDLAVDRPIELDERTWRAEWLADSDDCFVAVEAGAIVGMAGFQRDADRPERAENVLTAVRRDRRGRGIARALKQATIRLASERGLDELYTWTQAGNTAMRALNRSLGYVDRDVSITVRGRLPLPS